MSNQLSAVPIAGHVRAMKTPRHRLEFGEGSVLDRTLDAFGGFEEIVVVHLGDAGPVEEAAAQRAKLVSLPEEDAPIGAQLRAGVEAIRPGKGFAIAICDQAVLTRELVDGFAESFLGQSDKILVPVCQRQIGMPSIFPASMTSEFTGLADDGSAWPIVQAHGDELNEIELYETAVLRHIEDIEDYHQMLKIAGIPLPETESEETHVG